MSDDKHAFSLTIIERIHARKIVWTRPRGYKTFVMLNCVVYPVHKLFEFKQLLAG